MKLTSLTLPDDPAALPAWLDHQLVGSDLGRLVVELTLIHCPTDDQPNLGQLLGSHANDVQQHGLAKLPRERLQNLLRHPQSLLELQEQVLTNGGRYWHQFTTDAEANGLVDRGLNQLRSQWTLPAPSQKPQAWYARPAVVSLATAAAVLVAVYATDQFRFAKPDAPVQVATAGDIGWGWAKSGAVLEKVPAKDYLNQLADGADEWFKKRPDDSIAVAQRINEFRTGCTALIFAAHTPLPEVDRKWLVERCRVWGERLDKHREAVEAGKAARAVRDDVDELTRQISAALRSRAQV